MALTSETLETAYKLIRDGKKAEAARLLLPIVRADKNDADAWWLLANAISDPVKIEFALEEVLRIRPYDEKAQRKLDGMTRPIRSGSRPLDDATPADDPIAESLQQDAAQMATSRWSNPSPDDPFVDDPFADVPAADGSMFYDEKPKTTPSDDWSYATGAGASATTSRSIATRAGEADYTSNRSRARWADQPTVIVKRSNTSPLMVILAAIGGLALLVCGVCALVTLSGASLVGEAFSEVVSQMTAMPPGSFESSSERSIGARLPTDLNRRGALELGGSITGRIQDDRDDSWTFSGSRGDQVVIELQAVGNDMYDPLLMLYSPENFLVAENDDIDLSESNTDSRIEYTLQENGTFTIQVSKWSFDGGEYRLSLQRGGNIF